MVWRLTSSPKELSRVQTHDQLRRREMAGKLRGLQRVCQGLTLPFPEPSFRSESLLYCFCLKYTSSEL